jgi:hypothetical protein
MSPQPHICSTSFLQLRLHTADSEKCFPDTNRHKGDCLDEVVQWTDLFEKFVCESQRVPRHVLHMY